MSKQAEKYKKYDIELTNLFNKITWPNVADETLDYMYELYNGWDGAVSNEKHKHLETSRDRVYRGLCYIKEHIDSIKELNKAKLQKDPNIAEKESIKEKIVQRSRERALQRVRTVDNSKENAIAVEDIEAYCDDFYLPVVIFFNSVCRYQYLTDQQKEELDNLYDTYVNKEIPADVNTKGKYKFTLTRRVYYHQKNLIKRKKNATEN